MISPDSHLQIGSLLFEGLDQIDLTGPFEVFSRIPIPPIEFLGRPPLQFGICAACAYCRMPF